MNKQVYDHLVAERDKLSQQLDLIDKLLSTEMTVAEKYPVNKIYPPSHKALVTTLAGAPRIRPLSSPAQPIVLKMFEDKDENGTKEFSSKEILLHCKKLEREGNIEIHNANGLSSWLSAGLKLLVHKGVLTKTRTGSEIMYKRAMLAKDNKLDHET